MSFFRPPSEAAPGFDRNLPWPIHGLAYVAMWMSPVSAGPLIGLLTSHWGAAAVGLLLGIGISLLNDLLIAGVFEPWVARNQRYLQRRTPRLAANVAAFAWTFLLSGISLLSPLALFGSGLLLRFR